MILIRLEFGDRFVMLLICSGFWFRYGLGNYLDMVLIWFGNRAPYFRVPDRLASSKETETASGSCSFFFPRLFGACALTQRGTSLWTAYDAQRGRRLGPVAGAKPRTSAKLKEAHRRRAPWPGEAIRRRGPWWKQRAGRQR